MTNVEIFESQTDQTVSLNTKQKAKFNIFEMISEINQIRTRFKKQKREEKPEDC